MKLISVFFISFIMLSYTTATHPFGWPQWCVTCYDYFSGGSYHEKDLSQKFTITTQEKVRLINEYGSVTVKSTWPHKKILLTAQVRSKSPENLNTVYMVEKQSETLCECKATSKGPSTDFHVNYEAIIPDCVALEVITNTGTITVKEITKPAMLTTHDGAISVYKTHRPLVAHATHRGSISVEHALDTVRAITGGGSIEIYDAHSTVVAHTKKGNISLKSTVVPSTARIELISDNGSITSHVPAGINADLQAHSKKGTIICKHPVTLRPITTTITKNTFDTLKHSIDGTLGSGEAQMYLSSLKGNIAIEKISV